MENVKTKHLEKYIAVYSMESIKIKVGTIYAENISTKNNHDLED